MTNVLKLAKVAQDAGVGVSIGSMMEGDIGVEYAARVALKVAPNQVHDLDASWWLKGSHLKYEYGNLVKK